MESTWVWPTHKSVSIISVKTSKYRVLCGICIVCLSYVLHHMFCLFEVLLSLYRMSVCTVKFCKLLRLYTNLTKTNLNAFIVLGKLRVSDSNSDIMVSQIHKCKQTSYLVSFILTWSMGMMSLSWSCMVMSLHGFQKLTICSFAPYFLSNRKCSLLYITLQMSQQSKKD